MPTGGRREPVTLSSILKFVTGSFNEPLLGYSLEPSLTFDPNISLPHANTCINRLTLPLMQPGYDFDKLDLAFTNDFFGFI
jgi:hypothetical protein